MKTITVAAMAFACLGMIASSALAQETVVAKVPFAFVVHGQEMPAGNYSVTTDAGVITIRGTNNRSASYALATPADGRDPAGDDPSLVFVRYENHNILSQVWESGTDGISIMQRAGVPNPRRADAQRQSSVVLASASTPTSDKQ